MKKTIEILKNIMLICIIMCVCFISGQLIQNTFADNALIPSVFVLGAFVIALITPGYIYGIITALLSVLAVNFAFTFPYFKINFTIPGNLISAIILLAVSFITCALTSELKRQEAIREESERERMRANLLRAVSHDLRTPLTTICGSSSALLEHYASFSTEQKLMMVKGIKEDSEWLSRIVENLLSITKLDGGNVDIIKTETVLDELVDSILLKFAKRYPNQEVGVDIPEDFTVIPMDAILIEQVAINILENAVQHAEGMTELKLKVFIISNKAIFEISDNGCGIEKDRLKNIFTGYYTSQNKPADGKNNAGIGLSVCASIIKAHGGEIKAENLKEGGMVFRFTLDMNEKDE